MSSWHTQTTGNVSGALVTVSVLLMRHPVVPVLPGTLAVMGMGVLALGQHLHLTDNIQKEKKAFIVFLLKKTIP